MSSATQAESREQETQTEPIVLFPHKISIAYHFNEDLSRALVEGVDGRRKDYSFPGLDGYFKLNKETGQISGGSLSLSVLANTVLQTLIPNSFLPGAVEGRELDSQGELSNGVYRVFGLALFDEQEPNQEIAKYLIKEARKRNIQTPILVSPRDLTPAKDRITFAEHTPGLISGEEAVQYLKDSFSYIGNSGAHGLGRDRDGRWVAGWDSVSYSGAGGLVDFYCGEATQKNIAYPTFEKAVREINTKFQSQIAEVKERKERAIAVLEGIL